MTRLFRAQALAAQEARMLGEATIVRPLSLRLLTALLCLIVGSLLVASATTSYARKEVVAGYLLPEHGIVEINASRAGVVEQVLVREGDEVEAGAPLLTIRANRTSGDGVDLEPEMIRTLQSQLAETERLAELAKARYERREQQLRIDIDGILAERRALESRIETQRRVARLGEESLGQVRELAGRGYVSRQQVTARHELLLTAQQSVAALVQEAAVLERELATERELLLDLPLQLRQELSEIRSRRSALEFRRLELAERQSTNLLAPVAGTISAGVVDEGDSVTAQQALLSLLPAASRLEAHLFVPTRAIGYLETGQRVRLLYDAFDYRQHGFHEGRIVEISSAALPAAETLRRIRRDEPTYKVRVALAAQHFQTPGRQFALQPGMTLRADVILDRRTILGWLAQPVLALKHRT